MNSVYRKIIVGSDYLNAMVIKEGQSVIGSRAVVDTIIKNESNNRWYVYIKSVSSGEIYEWKSFPDSIVSTENYLEL